MTINNTIFENNHVETSASAIRNGQYATCILTNNIFKNNWGNEYNNTIDSNQGILYLSNNTINTKRAEIYNYPGIEFGKITSKVTATVLNNMTLPTSFEDEVVLSVVIRDDNGNLIELPFGVYFKINNNTEEVSAEFDGKTGSYTWDYIIREDGLVTVSIECESFDDLTIETATYNVTAIDVNVVNISSASYGDTVNIVVNVSQEGIGLNGTVSVNINNNKYNATIVNGSGTIEIPNLNAGSYSSAMVFTGKEFEYPISKEVSFNVLKDKSILTAKDSSYVINYGGKYSVTLKDVEGNAIVGKTVTFTLNGKNIGSAVTGSNGAATITLTAKTLKTAKAGKKNLVIKFESVNYYVVSKTVKITVNKEKTKITAKNKKFKKSKKIKKYAILLKNSKGKAISKQKVTLKVNGKNYIAKTNAKGKAIFKIKKLNKKGKFSAKITFKGNSYYNKAVKKIKLNIK